MFNKMRQLWRLGDSAFEADVSGSGASTNPSTNPNLRSATDDTIETKRIGPVFLVTFNDSRILDHDRILDTSRALERLLGEPVKSVVLDCGRVEFMASAMLTKLILFRKLCQREGVALRICSLAPAIYEVFKLTRLLEIFVVDLTCTASLSELLAPEGFPAPACSADWLVCADWWEEQGYDSIAQACRDESRCGS